jgi:hypothetical protein
VPSKVQQRRMEKTHRLKYAFKMMELSVINSSTRNALLSAIHSAVQSLYKGDIVFSEH